MKESKDNKYCHYYINESQRKRMNNRESLGKYTVMTSKEKKLLDLSKKVLEDQGIDYYIDPRYPKILEFEIENKNRSVLIVVSLLKNRIDISVNLPYRVKQKAVAIVALYLADLQKYNPFYILDKTSGKLYVNNSIYCNNPMYFDEMAFWECILSSVSLAFREYSILQELSVGLVPLDYRWKYRRLFEMSAMVCEGYQDNDQTYGTDELYQTNPMESAQSKNDTNSNSEQTVDTILDEIDKICADVDQTDKTIESDKVDPSSEVANDNDSAEGDITMDEFLSSLCENDSKDDEGMVDGDE